EISEKYGLEVKTVDNSRDVYKGADIVAGCTDSAGAVVVGQWVEEGTDVSCVGGEAEEGTPKGDVVFARLGNAPAPWGLPQFGVADEYLTYAAKPKENAGFAMKRTGERGHGVIAEDRAVFLSEILSGKKHGRTSRKQITYSERGNIQGAQFFAVAGKGYELAEEKGPGRESSPERGRRG